MNGFSTETALCTMKVTNFSRLSKLIAKNTPDYVLGEHRTVGVDVGGSLGKVPCSEELARQIQGPGVSTVSKHYSQSVQQRYSKAHAPNPGAPRRAGR
tara:strand:+ start:364 stop:657 length:294 start_codon:yes stop_codon:yes gene_type:complete